MTVGSDSTPDAAAAPRRRRQSQRQLEASLENRSAIVRSALAVFAHYGYTKTTLQAVAERVGLTRTGLLHHFGSKEGLFLAVIEEGRRRAERRAKQTAAGRGLDGIRGLRGALGTGDKTGDEAGDEGVHVKFVQTLQGEALHEDAPEYLVASVRSRLSQIRNHVTMCLEQARRDGEIGDVDIPALATMIAGTMNGLQVQWLLDESVQTEPALDALVDLLACTASRLSPPA